MAVKRKVKKPKKDPVADELREIKRLLILQLVTSGVQAKDIAGTLGVNESVVSRLVHTRKVKTRQKKD